MLASATAYRRLDPCFIRKTELSVDKQNRCQIGGFIAAGTGRAGLGAGCRAPDASCKVAAPRSLAGDPGKRAWAETIIAVDGSAYGVRQVRQQPI